MSRAFSRRQLLQLAGTTAASAALPGPARVVLPAATLSAARTVTLQLGHNDFSLGHYSDAIHYSMEAMREWSAALAAFKAVK